LGWIAEFHPKIEANCILLSSKCFLSFLSGHKKLGLWTHSHLLMFAQFVPQDHETDSNHEAAIDDMAVQLQVEAPSPPHQ
jgi:hypothetical protein